MIMKYTFTAKDLEIIKEARKKNKDKRAEVRLHVLELRAEGKRAKEIAEIVGVSAPYVSQLAATYFAGGIKSSAGNHYGGNRRNMTVEEEELILKPFYERAEKGEIIEVSEIEKAYQEKVDHKISSGQIYLVLRRHGWRKKCRETDIRKKRNRRRLKPQKNETNRKGNNGKFHNSTVRLMFQDKAGFGRINKPKYCWCKTRYSSVCSVPSN